MLCHAGSVCCRFLSVTVFGNMDTALLLPHPLKVIIHHVIVRQSFFVTVLSLALWQLSQLMICELIQLLLDLCVLPPVGEVVRRVPAIGQAVDIGVLGDEELYQLQVLEVHRKVKRAAAIALLLGIDICAKFNKHLHH
uniref:Uncharacterized protein n=1 Tax=Anguilla anguilla TaxID=7936 RepID=A0A0E9WSR3_ANGAN